MGRPITANIPHSLGKQEARRRLDEGFSSMQRNLTGGVMSLLSFQQRWEGDRLHFDAGGLGQKISGRLDVLDDAVQIQVDLPELLAALADKIRGSLTKGTTKLLEQRK